MKYLFVMFRVASVFCFQIAICLRLFSQSIDFSIDSSDFHSRFDLAISSASMEKEEDWTGFYSSVFGGDEGSQLVLLQDKKFMFRNVRSFGFGGEIEGSILHEDGIITLNAQQQNASKPISQSMISKSMVVVQSPNHVFIVPKERIHGFFLDFTSDDTYAKNFYLKRECARPNLIESVMPRPLHIFSSLPEMVGKIKSSKTVNGSREFIVNFESADHIFTGMIFGFHSPENDHESNSEREIRERLRRDRKDGELKVKRIERGECILEPISQSKNVELPSIGSKVFSSRAPWR